MKRILMTIALAVVGVVLFSSAMFAAGTAAAAGPSAGTGPWISESSDPCFTNGGSQGHFLVNTNSGRTHCFAD